MGPAEFLLAASLAVAGILATAVYGMLALPQGYFRAARICAWAAALILWEQVSFGVSRPTQCLLLRALIVGAVGAIAAIGLNEGLRQIKELSHHDKTSTPEKQPVDLPKSSLKYITFVANVMHFHKTNKTAVQMHVELKNTAKHLVRFHARINGNVMEKTSPDGQIEFDGLIGPDETKKLLYDRI